MARLSLQTISGKFIFMSALFIAVLISLTILIVYQNNQAETALTGIQQIRIPIRLITGNVIGSLDRVMSQQRAYMLSGNVAFKEERKNVYTNDIYPALNQLMMISKSLPEDQQQSVHKIEAQVKSFESVQNGILDFFENKMLPHMQRVNSANEDKWLNLTESFAAKLKAEKEISERIKEADNIRAELLKQVTEIRNYQETMLRAEMESIAASQKRGQLILVGLSILIFVFLMAFTFINIKSLRNSIRKPVSLINTLALGALPETVEDSNDELNEILEAGQKLTTNIRNASAFALAIGEGRLNEQFQEASDKDVLGKSLLHMRERLQAIAQEEQKRNWAVTGIAELGNILRDANGGSEELYLKILSYLIKYVQANQGALYIAEQNGDTTILKMVSSYAYGKRKYITQEIEPGQGLVGQCFLEKGLIYIKEVPKEYVRITSGLGDAPPRSVLICPLLVNDEVFGVIEMASFHEFEKHTQAFVKNASEQIASVIASVKNNERTASLLRDSQQQTEELRAQEEEMRQNMEELAATQEEMARKEKEYMNKIKMLEKSSNQDDEPRFSVAR